MAYVHVLVGGDSGGSGVVHFAMPTGNNAMGVPWKTCYQFSLGGRIPTSKITVVGNGLGQITQQELNQIQSSDVVEVDFTYGVDPDMTDEQKLGNIDIYAGRVVEDFKVGLMENYKYYGLTRP